MRKFSLAATAQVVTVLVGLVSLFKKEAREFYSKELAVPVWAVIIAVFVVWFVASWLIRRAQKTGPEPSTSDGPRQTEAIRYYDMIKLVHKTTGHALHSHNVLLSHPGSSRQQQVTAFGGTDPNDYWIVKAQHELKQHAKKGQPVLHGDVIRLEHRNTRKNLHSHKGVLSPVSKQQEVTAYGRDGLGDVNDNWRIDIMVGGSWNENASIRLIHVTSTWALHSHAGQAHPQFTSGQQEVTCFSERDENDFWFAVPIEASNS